MFEGVVIRTDRKGSFTNRITVRKIASGVGVERCYLLHSPLVEKVEVVKRSKVRRNFLSFLRNRTGKSARLVSKKFDKSINDLGADAEAAEAKIEAAAKASEAAEHDAAAKKDAK